MAYNIYRADGTPVTVPDNTIDSQFYDASANGPGKGIGTLLVGRNAIDYGAPVAQTLLQLTENFAGTVTPSDAKSSIGQLWFNKTTSSIFVKVTDTESGLANWRKISTIALPGDTGSDGDIKVDGGIISIWANGAWRQVFPAVYS